MRGFGFLGTMDDAANQMNRRVIQLIAFLGSIVSLGYVLFT